MFGPGDWGSVATFDSAAGGEDEVERVYYGVSGVVDELHEAEVVEEILGIRVGGVVQVEVECAEEYVVDVEGGGNEVCDEVGSWAGWPVYKSYLDGCSHICLDSEVHVFHGRGGVVCRVVHQMEYRWRMAMPSPVCWCGRDG